MTAQELFTDSTYEFEKSAAFERLLALAKEPFDLTAEGGLTPQRLQRMQVNGCGIRLLFGTQRVTDEVMQALFELAKEARVVEKMQLQQDGAVVNRLEGHPSEERQVLHTAMRDLFEQPHTAPEAVAATKAAKVELEKLDAFLTEIDRSQQFTDMIFIGIGGSELGPKMVYYALQRYRRPNRRVHFISNVAPDDAAQVLQEVDLRHSLVVSVSKSGSTLETKTNEELVRHHYEQAGLNPQDHFVAVTGEGSPMDDSDRFRACFYIWDFVGGRYCVTSMVGGVMLGFGFGMEVYLAFLKGASAMDKQALEPEPSQNLPLIHALLGVWNRNFLGYPTVAVIPYSATLHRFAAHIQQADMESNGKHIDRRGHRISFPTGPIVWGEPATNAQHSFFQLIHQGTDIIPVEFIGLRESQFGLDLEVNGTTSQEKLLANLFAQCLGLATGQASENPNKSFEGNRPSSLLLAERLDPYTVGVLLALYEHKVAYQGYLWNINSFDQEGVQLGKVLANRILTRIAQRKQGEDKEAYPLGDVLLDQMETV